MKESYMFPRKLRHTIHRGFRGLSQDGRECSGSPWAYQPDLDMDAKLLEGAHGRTALFGPDFFGVQGHMHNADPESSKVYGRFLMDMAFKYHLQEPWP